MTNKVSLMSSILQYAMEGKLVSQNKSDSKSEEFLFYLLKNKGKKYNKIVFDNGKYYEIIKGIKKDVSKEISVKIPESWTYIRLNDLVDKILIGGTPLRTITSYYHNGNIPWVKIGDMKSKYINETSELITQDGMNNSSAKLLPIGTILYSIIANIGTTAFLNIEACTNQGIAGMFFDDSLNKEFIYYFLKNSATYMMKQSHGTAYNSINSKNLKNMFIPFPPIEEQERIVAKIKKLEPLLDKYEELIKQRNILDENLAKK